MSSATSSRGDHVCTEVVQAEDVLVIRVKDSLFPDIYSDRVKTDLQRGSVYLTDGQTLGELIGLAQALGIDPNDIIIRRGGVRQIKLRVLPK